MVQVVFSDPIYLWFLLALPLLVFVHFMTLKSTNRKAVKFAIKEFILAFY